MFFLGLVLVSLIVVLSHGSKCAFKFELDVAEIVVLYSYCYIVRLWKVVWVGRYRLVVGVDVKQRWCQDIIAGDRFGRGHNNKCI